MPVVIHLHHEFLIFELLASLNKLMKQQCLQFYFLNRFCQGVPGAPRGGLGVLWVPFLMVFWSTLGEFCEEYSINNSMERSGKATMILHKKSEDVYFFWASSVQVSHAARTAATSK